MGRPKTEKNAALPPRMLLRKRGKRKYYFYGTPGANRVEIALGSDWESAMLRYHAIHAEGTRAAVPGGTAKALHKSIIKNAKAKGVSVSITASDVQRLIDESGNRCAVTGFPFDSTQFDGQRIRPWMPSVDRIRCGGPYSLDNVRLVCAAVNVSMNQFGEEVFFRIAAAVVARKRILRKKAQSAEIN